MKDLKIAACLDLSQLKFAAIFFENIFTYEASDDYLDHAEQFEVECPHLAHAEPLAGLQMYLGGLSFRDWPIEYDKKLQEKLMRECEDLMEAGADRRLCTLKHWQSITEPCGWEISDIFAPSSLTIGMPIETSDLLIISELPMIDADKLSWETIVEMRKDPETIQALRDLRLMWFEDYQGKPKSYVEDSILKKIEIYQEKSKTWGLQTRHSVLELLFSHKNAAAIAGFSSCLFGAPLTQAALIGASATLGAVGVQLQKRSSEKLAFLQSDPIRYLVNLKNHTSG